MGCIADRTTLYLSQAPNYPNLDVDIENQVLQRVMLVAQQRVVTLQEFTQDGSDACILMNNKQQNPPRLVWHAIWLLIREVYDNRDLMLVKPGGTCVALSSSSCHLKQLQ